MVEMGWTEKRIARLAFLVGVGRRARDIAIDMDVSENSVFHQAARLTLHFRTVPNALIILLSPVACETFTKAAESRRMTPEKLLTIIAEICAAEPHLIQNILDEP